MTWLGVVGRVLRTALVAVVWVPLAVFTLTSSGSRLAQLLVMGLGLYLVIDFWVKERRSPEVLHQQLFWPIKRTVSERERKLFLFLFTGVFGLLILLLI